MSPRLIDGHDKNLIWLEPDDACLEFANIIDDAGDEHIAILSDEDGIARLYLRHITSGQISANFVFEFELVPPGGFPARIPQVVSAFVGEDFRSVKLAQHAYQTVMEHYGVIVSDVRQTAGGMFIWLLMAENDNVKINVMEIHGENLEYRMIGDEPEAYTGAAESLQQISDTIWGDPDTVISPDTLDRIGFRPTHQNMEHVVLAARIAFPTA
ncbi:hypothetical protein PE051_01595 [Enterobacter asburiae]|jgi:hypothetical protein|uniref:Uncharacterized protein n=1 Tax=Enterobacter asburiae TaxID=61645 RepID=A0AAW7ZLK4_ENTAS|nr:MULTISPECIES: hypothetical protein [Enterobacter]ALL15897.1 hypothetical protein NI40_001585 [Enterobacter sp. E20]KJI62719.1 membrane protein [Enterobacter asburiae]KJW77065.1 membrane protein [Enterobacter asburiae]KJX03945.1 membrane protein [Enterobacter asburiae]KLF96904.1 membrane protein [Enterobacter asburiae]